MKISVIAGILIIALCIGCVYADVNKDIIYQSDTIESCTFSGSDNPYQGALRFQVMNEDEYDGANITELEFDPYDSSVKIGINYGYTISASPGYLMRQDLTTFATGYIFIESSHRIRFVVTSLDAGSHSGYQSLFVMSTYGGGNYYVTIVDDDGQLATGSYSESFGIWGGLSDLAIGGTTYTTVSKDYMANLDIKSTDIGGIVESIINLTRVIDGYSYYSWFSIVDDDGYIYQNSSFDNSNVSLNAATYPLNINVSFSNTDASPILYTYLAKYYSDGGIVTGTLTPTPTPVSCGITSSLELSKYTNIFPLEYINGTLTLSSTSPLQSITWMYGPGPGSTFDTRAFASFTNVSGTWYVTRDDLGIITGPISTTYEDALTESMRFPTDGNYIVRVGSITQGGCSASTERPVYVNPTSGVNVWIYFRDGLTSNLIGDATALIQNVNITGNTTFNGNPIVYAASIGDNLSIYATADGYTPHQIYYIIPAVTGNHLEIPLYLFPAEIGDIYPGNTTLVVNVKTQSTGDPIYNALVTTSQSGIDIDEDLTNGEGYAMLQIPYRAGSIRIDVNAYPYHAQSRYVALNNETWHEETFWLAYSGTPTYTPTPTYDPNATYTATPTGTETPAPTTTIVTKPKLVVEVHDSNIGSGYLLSGATVRIYDGDETDKLYVGPLLQTAITGSNGRTASLQMESNAAYWCVVNKTGYYTNSERFRMSAYDSTRYVALVPVGAGVTVVTTVQTLSPGAGGGVSFSQGGWIKWLIDNVMTWFGVDETTARLFLGLFITLLCAVFVGGALSGFGSGEGAATGALIGGCFGWAIVCILQLVYIWLLPVSIAFVGLAFFVWRRGSSD